MEAKTEGQRQAEAARDELHRIILNALDYEREAFEAPEDEEEQVEGGDLVEFFCDWRRKAEAALTALAIYGPPEVPLGVVRVEMMNGLINDVSATVEGLRVIITEQDKDLDPDAPEVVTDADGTRYWVHDWTPTGDPIDRASVAAGVKLAEEKDRRVTAADKAGER